MILFDTEIEAAVGEGSVVIDPYDAAQLGPNSYDVRLGPELICYRAPDGYNWIPSWAPIDMRDPSATPIDRFHIQPAGHVLVPGRLYLGHTIETVGTTRIYVPHIEGRSSIGRLGMAVHVTAGFGDVGFVSQWTLEITVIHPLRVYAGERVAQAYFLEGRGQPRQLYDREYADQDGPVPSRGSR